LQDAYRGLLMTGRYPVAFLFLELPPDQVDVNVHPAKGAAEKGWHILAGVITRKASEAEPCRGSSPNAFLR